MSAEHEIEWEFDCGIFRGRVICNATPDADCHLAGGVDCECESLTIERDPDGTPFHMAYSGGEPEYVRHELRAVDYCNITEWLESGDIEEMCRESFVVARTPIEPVWCGDYYDWKPVRA